MSIRSEAVQGTVTTSNLLAGINVDSDDDDVAMFGAHLDGVRAGAGINDNGHISEYTDLDIVSFPNCIVNVRAGDGAQSTAPTDRLRGPRQCGAAARCARPVRKLRFPGVR